MLKFAMAGAVASLICLTAGAQDDVRLANAPPPWTATDGAVIDYTVLRKGKPFGSHVLTFDRGDDGALEVTTDVDLQVKIGPFTAFRYRLDSTEKWVDGQLVSLEGETNNDGKKGSVSARAEDDELIVDGSKFDGAVPATIIPSSHWNILQVFSDRMLSTETGAILDIDVEEIGPETVTVGNQEVEATHYRLKSDLTVDLWYDNQSRWVKLTFEARGDTIEYVLNALY